jgi:hypothetical protein
MDVVISRFNEDTQWVSELNGNVFLYDKSELKIENSIPLENIGRESDTYLEHILRNYETINNTCAFLQGNPFDHHATAVSDVNSYNGGMVHLGNTYRSDGFGKPHHPTQLAVKETADLIGLDHDGYFDFVAGAQYIVPSENIKNKTLAWWKKLKDIHDSTPEAPWVFERLWTLIFS